MDELYPITRSITGEGVRKTLKIIQNFIEEGDYFNKLINGKNLRAKVIKAVSSDNIYVELIEFINAKKLKVTKPKKYTKFAICAIEKLENVTVAF